MLTDAPTNTNVRQRITIKRCAFLFHACLCEAQYFFPSGNHGHPKSYNDCHPLDDHTCCYFYLVKIKEAQDYLLSGNHGKPKAYNQYICACMHGKEKHSA